VQRNDRIHRIQVTPKIEDGVDMYGETKQVKRIGITPQPDAVYFQRFGFFDAVYHAWITESNLTFMTHKAIIYLLLGKMDPKQLAGPVGIISLTGQAASKGLPYLLQLMAVMSVSLAVINLFPIPALDGGHFFFLLIELFTKKRVSLVFQERAAQIGFTVLLCLMVFVVYNDLVNLGFVNRIREFLTGS